VGWRNLVSLNYAIIISFMLFTVFPLVYVLYFGEFLIHDSRGFMILEQRAAAREMPGVREHESLQRAVAREVPDVR